MNKLLTLLIVFLLCSSGIAAQTTGWSNGGGNSQRNGYTGVAGPASDSVLWQVNSPGFFGTPLLIEGNYLVTMRFLSQNYAPVECYELTTGNLLWSVDVTNLTGRSLPVGIRDGRVFVVNHRETQNDSLFALNLTDGSRLWKSDVTVAPYISETAVFDATGDLYIGGNQKTFKINPETGAKLWQVTTVPMASGSGEMAINNDNNTGYTLEQSGGVSYVWAINLATGTKKYRHIVKDLQPGGNVPQSALMVGNDGVVYVHLTQDNIAAFADDGVQLNLLWQTEIYGNSSFSLMTMGADGTVFVPSDGGIIRLDPQNGSVLNTSPSITQGGFYSPRLSATSNNLIFATTGEDYVYAFDLSLNPLWSDYLPNTNTSGVSFASNGIAVAAGRNTIRAYVAAQQTSTIEEDRFNISLFPNPAASFIVIQCNEILENNRFSITDGSGRILQTGFMDSQQKKVYLPESQKGVFFVRIEGANRAFPVVKE
ncbi:MAG: PQQ-binding-like beta-propeller repeat protein [Bacteroidota bacterium]